MKEDIKVYKVAVIGDQDSILGFNALGMDVFPAEKAETAAKLIDELAENGYAVIFITEPLAETVKDKLAFYREKELPAIVPVPSVRGDTGMGMQQVKDSVQKAVGIDILGIGG